MIQTDMKKSFKISILTLFLFSLNNQAMAVNVGGLIDVDTAWDASEPHVIVSPVQIAPGATLTIEKGAVVSGGSIEVFGNLNVVGEDGRMVFFDHVDVLPGNNSSSSNNPFTMSIHFAEFNSGGLYRPNSGVYGSLILEDSILRNTSMMYIGYPVANVLIEQNTFINAGKISVFNNDNIIVNIKNNAFYGLYGGAYYESDCAIEIGANYVPSIINIEFNSFLNLKNSICLASSVNADINGTNNWWGSTDTSTIEGEIIDRTDDLAVSSHVNYIPFLIEPHPNTPQFTLNTPPTANAGSNQIVFDAIILDGSKSIDSEDINITYSWLVTHHNNGSTDIYLGSPVEIKNVEYGFYDVLLTVKDPEGLSDTATMSFAATGTTRGDIDGNQKVGLEEAIHALRVSAGTPK